MVRETHPTFCSRSAATGRPMILQWCGNALNRNYSRAVSSSQKALGDRILTLPDVLEALQFVIAGNQDLRPGGDGRRHDGRVIPVLDGEVRQVFRLGHDGILADEFQVFGDQRFRNAELYTSRCAGPPEEPGHR